MARYQKRNYGRRKGGPKKRKFSYWMIVALVMIALIVFFYKLKPGSEPGEIQAGDQPAGDITQPTDTDNSGGSFGDPVLRIDTAPEPPAIIRTVKKETVPSKEPINKVLAGDNKEAIGLIEEAVINLKSRPVRVIEARNLFTEVLLMPISKQQEVFVKQQMADLSSEWLFSRKFYPQDGLCDSYKVKSGDNFAEIGKKYKVPHQVLMGINNIRRPELLRADSTIKVINGPFNAMIYLSEFRLDLYLQTTYVRSYSIGIGKKGRETPTGLWLVKKGGKLISPPWTDPDTQKVYHPEAPDYPLGSRWIGLKGLDGKALGRTGFALHGTKDRESIGKQSSRGCIRLYNGEVIQMYNMLVEGYSKVRIAD